VDKGDSYDDSSPQEITADFVKLGGKCREAPERLAAEIWASEQDLHKNHVGEDAEDVTAHLTTAASGLGKAATPTSCAALLAAYLVLREG
jgi:hypothetical protein